MFYAIIRADGAENIFLRSKEMEIKRAGKENFEKISVFCRRISGGNAFDEISLRMIRGILKHSERLPERMELLPCIVLEEEEIKAFFILISTREPKEGMQIAFLNFVREERVLEFLLRFAKQRARKKGIEKLIAGVNIHMHYGFGILEDHFDLPPSFGSSHHPPYYVQYLEKYAACSQKLYSYRSEAGELRRKILEADQKTEGFEIRRADFRSPERTAYLYSEIGRRAYENQAYYSELKKEEARELLEGLKLFLKDENLLFAFFEGKPAGYLLWYPDFNQLLDPGEKIGLGTLLKYKLRPELIHGLKIADIAVIPKFQKRGAAYALAKYCCGLDWSGYREVKTAAILESNRMGIRMAERFFENRDKTYRVFEIEVS